MNPLKILIFIVLLTTINIVVLFFGTGFLINKFKKDLNIEDIKIDSQTNTTYIILKQNTPFEIDDFEGNNIKYPNNDPEKRYFIIIHKKDNK